MIEHGLFQSIDSFGKICIQLLFKTENNGYGDLFEFKPISLDGFLIALILFYIHVIFIIVISALEIIWYHIQRLFNHFNQAFDQILHDLLMK